MTQSFEHLRRSAPAVLPSMLLCDFGNLERELQRLAGPSLKGLHLDVMDGHFVPNLTYGMPIVEAFSRLTDLPLDVHLMIDHPERYVAEFAAAGASTLTVHVEALTKPADVLKEIYQLGVGVGIALNPATPLNRIEPVLELCDIVLVMSVPAGFGGQPFHPVALEKLRQLRQAGPPELLLEVDGGINLQTIGPCAEAGADLFVVGSAIFRQRDYAAALSQLDQLVAAHSSRQA